MVSDIVTEISKAIRTHGVFVQLEIDKCRSIRNVGEWISELLCTQGTPGKRGTVDPRVRDFLATGVIRNDEIKLALGDC